MLRVEGGGMLRSADRVVALVRYEQPKTRRLPPAGWIRDERGECLSATSEELDCWHAAALTYLSAVAAAAADVRLARWRWQRWRWRAMQRLPFAGRWVTNKIRHAEERYLHCIREAAEAYQPSLRQVEQRIADYEAARREEARQQWERQEARRRTAEAEFEEWQRGRTAFATAADLPGLDFAVGADALRVHRHGSRSLTARELATAVLERENGGLGRAGLGPVRNDVPLVLRPAGGVRGVPVR